MRTTLLFLLIIFYGIVCFFPQNGFAQKSVPMVRLIYFLPSDRKAQQDIDTRMDTMIKDVQQFFADEMELHGFGRKTFQLETDATGKAIVHHVIGQHTQADYLGPANLWHEIGDQFDLLKHVYVSALDATGNFSAYGAASNSISGIVRISAVNRFDPSITAHELGHALGLPHVRSLSHLMSRIYPGDQRSLSLCAAKWLDANKLFNTGHQSQDVLNPTAIAIEMLPRIASPPNAVRLRFKVTGANKLHSAHLLIHTTARGFSNILLEDCKELNSKSQTVEFVTTGITPKNNFVTLQVIDVDGNLKGQQFSVDITPLLPSKIVSIPNVHLAAAVREELDLAPDSTITSHAMLGLVELRVYDSEITDLTGLEHAVNLSRLYLGGTYLDGEWANGWYANSNAVSDFTPIRDLAYLTEMDLSYNSISDVSGLADLGQLEDVQLGFNSISDISAFAELTNLVRLDLSANAISDISTLTGLTQLTRLNLGDNPISDVAPLAELKKLRYLTLWGNAISDVSSLTDLVELEQLYLSGNPISDVSPLVGLVQLKRLYLDGNSISDVSPLVELSELMELDLRGNPLSYASINTHIPAMQAKGVEVRFNNVAYSALLKVSGDAQEGAPGSVLASPFIVEAMTPSGKPMHSVSVTFTVTEGGGKLSSTTAITDATGRAQTTLTLGRSRGKNTVTAIATEIPQTVLTFTAIAVEEPLRLTTDVNADGTVNVLDLITIVSNFDQTGPNSADVNGDGIVNLLDLVLVAGAFGDGDAAAPTLHPRDLEELTAADVQHLLMQARQIALTDPTYLRGITVLEQLLRMLVPKETALLANYPNPFNPETWIPYHLATASDVEITIYDTRGTVVRHLELGHQAAGLYQTRSRAAYWDGRNDVGERVASGIYFYQLQTGEMSLLRKMVILK